MGPAGRPPRSGPGSALAGRPAWSPGARPAWPRPHRLPRLPCWPHQPRGPARRRQAYGVDASFTLFLQYGGGIHALSAQDGREQERNRSHGSRRITPEPLGSPDRNEPPGRAVTPA
jgi:hypothetical protein